MTELFRFTDLKESKKTSSEKYAEKTYLHFEEQWKVFFTKAGIEFRLPTLQELDDNIFEFIKSYGGNHSTDYPREYYYKDAVYVLLKYNNFPEWIPCYITNFLNVCYSDRKIIIADTPLSETERDSSAIKYVTTTKWNKEITHVELKIDFNKLKQNIAPIIDAGRKKILNKKIREQKMARINKLNDELDAFELNDKKVFSDCGIDAYEEYLEIHRDIQLTYTDEHDNLKKGRFKVEIRLDKYCDIIKYEMDTWFNTSTKNIIELQTVLGKITSGLNLLDAQVKEFINKRFKK